MSTLKYQQRTPINFRLGDSAKFILGCALAVGIPSAIAYGVFVALSL